MAGRLKHCYYTETRGSLHLKLWGKETGKFLIEYRAYLGPDPVNYWKSLLKNAWCSEGPFWYDIQYPEHTGAPGKSRGCWMLWKIERLLIKCPKGSIAAAQTISSTVEHNSHVSCCLLPLCWDLYAFQNLGLISPSTSHLSETMWKYIINHLSLPLTQGSWLTLFVSSCPLPIHQKGLLSSHFSSAESRRVSHSIQTILPVAWVSPRNALGSILPFMCSLFAYPPSQGSVFVV